MCFMLSVYLVRLKYCFTKATLAKAVVFFDVCVKCIVFFFYIKAQLFFNKNEIQSYLLNTILFKSVPSKTNSS